MRHPLLPALLALGLPLAASEPPVGEGWVRIFDGSTLAGWHTTGGARWWVEDGAICGTQTTPGVGGFVFTDARTYGDVEVQADVWIDYGHDSGIHLRDRTVNAGSVTGDGYQCCIDYFAGRGTYGGFYYKGPKEDYAFWETTWPYRLSGSDSIGANAAMDPARVAPVLADHGQWPPVFNANDRFANPPRIDNGGWNTVRVRIVDDPPVYDCWINGLHVVHYRADRRWTTAREGMIGFQIINNTRRWPRGSAGRVKYRDVFVRPAQPAAPPQSGTLRLGAVDVQVDESAALATLTVERIDGTAGSVGVAWATADGTALAGEDYEPSAGTLVLADGQRTATVTVPLRPDALPEATESFTVSLSAPTGGVRLGTPSSAVVTIADDDAPGDGGEADLGFTDFEGGWGGWTSGGANAVLTTDPLLVPQGLQAAVVSNSLGDASSFWTTGPLDTAGLAAVRIEFALLAAQCGDGHRLDIAWWDGASWRTAASFLNGTDFVNGVPQVKTVVLDRAAVPFPAALRLRFEGRLGNRNLRKVAIDAIRITGVPDAPAAGAG